MASQHNNSSRRKFLQQSAIAGAGLTLAAPLNLFAGDKTENPQAPKGNIKSKGYAGRNTTDKLSSWNFERRPVGDDDILIEKIIKADEINEAWDKVVNKQARYRYVIDAATF